MSGVGYTFFGQCTAMTKTGTRCRHIVVYANGFCRQHRGSSAKFMRERIAKIKAKAMRRHARWRKLRQALRGRTP